MAGRNDARDNARAVAEAFRTAIDTASQGQSMHWRQEFARDLIGHLAYFSTSGTSYHRIACGLPRDPRFGKADGLTPCEKCHAEDTDAALETVLRW